MNVLHLTLKKKWFDMILSGEKKEEYREIKPYWMDRLTHFDSKWHRQYPEYAKEHLRGGTLKSWKLEYDAISFTNGYATDAPNMIVEFKGIWLGKGNTDWGANGDELFVISLGNILSTANLKP